MEKLVAWQASRPWVRFTAQFTLDIGVWGVALWVAQLLRYEYQIARINERDTLMLLAVAVLLQLIAGMFLRLYQGRYSFGAFDEVRAVTIATVGVAAMLFGVTMLRVLQVPRSTVPLALPIALLLMFALRYLARLAREALVQHTDREPALVFGAGYTGRSIIRRMRTDARAPYHPVGLLDDDPHKRHVRVASVDVLGCLDDLPEVVASTGARVLIVAIAGADGELLRRVADRAEPLHLLVKVLPTIDEILRGTSAVNDLRDLSIEDLMGRRPVDTDVETIAGYLNGKRVLVTGAGGSIGSELCRQIYRFGPSELIMLDRDETGLQAAELAVFGHGLLDGREVVLADIRDRAALQRIFDDRRPEVVFHAAALKHLPMLQQYPEEAWKTNVLGTRNVLEAARRVDVKAFINISTDKAASPTSVLGHSKRLAERLTARTGEETGKPYLSVRFGNVLGSRGSMLPLFTSMIESGGPLTVTHPDVTRYFMTIPEACQLVVQAGAIGQPGEVLILDMGEPVRILDVAQRMIEMSGRNIDITFTGLRKGEKLHEDLRSTSEKDHRPKHPLISHAHVPGIGSDELAWDRWQGIWVETANSKSRLAAGGR
jgi:dTDP-glucose 4,6-dehydratase